jgi:hypothetical protein
MPPPDADFSFTIHFARGLGDPRRVFDAASELIDGFEELDSALAGSLDRTLKPLMVLEDVEAGSLRVWLKTVLTKIDDKGLAEGEWKKAIGPALVAAKYAAIEWLNNDQKTASADAELFREKLRGIASQTDVRPLGDYPPIHEAKLVAALDSLQDGKRILGPGDKLTIETEDRYYEVDLSKTWDPSEAIPVTEGTTSEKQSEGEIIVTIRKPDMTGQSMWQFTRGKFPISARILDEQWLNRFHNREVALYSGDALRCKVKFTYVFDQAGAMIEEKIEITKVLEVIPGPGGTQLHLI